MSESDSGVWDGMERRSEPMDAEERAFFGALLTEEFREQNKRLRKALIYTVIAGLLLIAGATWYSGHTQQDVSSLKVIAEANNESLQILRGENPEINKARDQQIKVIIDKIVTKLDCSQREAFQDLLDSLVRRGVINEDDASTLVEHCNP